MIDLAATIEAMKASGMTSDEILRALACVQSVEPVAVPTRTARQERNRRYYRRLGVSAEAWQNLREAVFARDGLRCVYCGTDVSARPQCDHKHPLVLGGQTVFDNLVTACKSCNSAKSGLSYEDWVAICR